MWKEEKPIVPYNHTSHVKIDNLNFVAGLRRTVSVDAEIQKFRELKLSNQQQAAENKFMKPTNCIFLSCMYVGEEIGETLNEVISKNILCLNLHKLILCCSSENFYP
jgi:hypothetical protein